MGKQAHWNDRYRTIGTDQVSWFQQRPTISLDFLAAAGVRPSDSVIDAGGGASTLVDHLLAREHRDVTVLDLSSEALAAARARTGAESVGWIEADLLTWQPSRTWDVWHDRAVLHFLVDEADQATYVEQLRRALRPGGAFVIGTFAEDGPTQCSALPVRRYSPAELHDLVGDAEVIEQRRDVHRTPSGAEQPFNWIVGRLPAGT